MVGSCWSAWQSRSRLGAARLAHLDPLSEDEAGRVLRAVAEVPAPETVSQLLPRYIRKGSARRW